MPLEQLILVILLGAMLGAAGQCVRVIAGFKKLHGKAERTGTSVSKLIQLSDLYISLLIGAVAGVLGALLLWEEFLNTDGLQRQTVFTLLGMGYAGSDFIEAFIKKYVPESP
ncbi:hypothetical protein ED236_01795 [Pseudomethylobacillus aquaticus]|uniref:Uncharacterized protein n=1 Tax=Pseudomethylobacillus aquaticus TaxID=2676064 RepID=A0A3N0V600_9PROT|nr:hypothetical protein [Pseudomethylobacillus aquaticus]ROH88227.1 hypothetical protein ED236_01795 [Pseudomethylobacillus aquaticus]